MKRLLISALILMVTVTAAVSAQDEYQWNASVMTGGSYSGGDGMGNLGIEILREFGDNLEIGFRAYAQGELSNEYEDENGRGYHMSSAFGTLVVKPKVKIGERVEIGFPLESGNGLIQYRYNGEYREELRWTEEILDQINHSVYSAGIEPKFSINERSALSISAGYLVTGPLRTDLAEDGELDGFWGRLGYSVSF